MGIPIDWNFVDMGTGIYPPENSPTSPVSSAPPSPSLQREHTGIYTNDNVVHMIDEACREEGNEFESLHHEVASDSITRPRLRQYLEQDRWIILIENGTAIRHVLQRPLGELSRANAPLQRSEDGDRLMGSTSAAASPARDRDSTTESIRVWRNMGSSADGGDLGAWG
ncbi:hypothetical protein EK21DRAFT_92391 [Setomelanomma holmii]|uniref:Uncharacterized protein n=1 Tax=Setomelanomma holmii TaxID=210430 RepID=A0A9P4H2M4_9PLEO|nr:hypothetical protein EK21DRAFT_92391 [Setomelanomma holmii]